MPLTSRLLVATAVMASLLEIIDTSIVNVAIPTMMGNIGATLEDISWVVTGYIIANAIVLPISGWMGQQIGRRLYYTSCILIFTLTSVACGLAPNLTTLVIFRVLQGLAGGALLPTSQAIIQEQFQGQRAGMGSAVYGMSVMIGPTVGPTLGGYLTDHFGWRSIFNINLPLGLLTAVLAFSLVEDVPAGPVRPGAPARGRAPVDGVGLGLLALGIGCLQYVLERGQADDWFQSRGILICSILAAGALPAFVWWELKQKDPIVDVRLFKSSAVRSGTLLMGLTGMMLYGLVFILPVFVSNLLHYTATQTGMLFIPGALLTAACMPFVGSQIRKRDPRLLILTGVIIIEVSLSGLTRFTAQTGEWELFWPLLGRGLGMAFLFVPINTIVLGQFRGVQLGQVAGLLNLFRQIGGSIGIATLSTLLQRATAVNYLELASHVTMLDSATASAVNQTQGLMGNRLGAEVGLGSHARVALEALTGRVNAQVFVLSFNQILTVLLIAFAFAVLPLALMKRPKTSTGPVSAH